MSENAFKPGNERIELLLSDPKQAARVATVRESMAEADRQHAMGLAMVRNAAQLTQADLAKSLGISQAAVQKTEQRDDMLLSTLRKYVEATGAHVEILVRFPKGIRAELTLDEFSDDRSAADQLKEQQSAGAQRAVSS